MELNYIIHAHKSPKQLKRLIYRLKSEKVNFYIHIDRKYNLTPFKKEIHDIKNVYFFNDNERIEVIWSDISQVKATLIAIKKIIADKRTGYCILMSGQDYPIKSNSYIKNYFTINQGQNFINGNSMYSKKSWANSSDRISKYNFHIYKNLRQRVMLPSIFNFSFYSISNFKKLHLLLLKKHFTSCYQILFKRRFPKYIMPFGGSNWWAFPISTIVLIIDFLEKHPDYILYHEFTHCADEIFFHSIIFSNLSNTEITDAVTHVNWSRKNSNLPVTFTTEDYEELLVNNNKLFARKFDIEKDSAILDEIDIKIRKHNELP